MRPELQSVQNGYAAGAGQDVAVVQQRVLRNTYLLLAITMIPTAVGAFIGVNLNFGFMRSNPIIWSIGLLAVIYGMFFAIEKNKDSGLGVVLLLGLTLFLGVVLGPLLKVALGLRNGAELVAMAAGGTAAVFFAMAAIGTNAKRDFSFLTSFLLIGAIVIMLAVVANIFIASPVLHLTLCAVFVLFSSMMILWQLNQIVRGGEGNYVSATLTLYMSVYNLFTSLLHLLMALTGQKE